MPRGPTVRHPVITAITTTSPRLAQSASLRRRPAVRRPLHQRTRRSRDRSPPLSPRWQLPRKRSRHKRHRLRPLLPRHPLRLGTPQTRLQSCRRSRRWSERAKRKRPGNRGAPPLGFVDCGYAAFLASITLAEPLPIGMLRGFMASGISRTRSTWSSPFSRAAPFTTTWSASWKRRSKARAAMP